MLQEAGQTGGKRGPKEKTGRHAVRRRRLCGGWSGSGGQALQGVIIQKERQWPGQAGQPEGHQGKQRWGRVDSFGFPDESTYSLAFLVL